MNIKIAKELYAYTMFAKRKNETGIMTGSGACNVSDKVSFYHLSLSAYNRCHELFPLVDGWREHDVQYEKLSEDFIKGAIELVEE